MESKYDFSGGIGKLYLLFLLFLGLKLAGEISWSWWWVTLPLWLMPAVALFFLFIAFVLGFFVKRTNAWTRAQEQAKAMARREQLRARTSTKAKDIDQEYDKLT